MKVVTTIKELEKELQPAFSQSKQVGFCPTMGFLHDGHLSLIKESKRKSQVTVVSIYVNPSQFNNASDFDTYPRDLDADLSLLETSECDLVFVPSKKEIESIPLNFSVNLSGLDTVMEGIKRPGHFKGVVEVVYRLFTAVKPNIAFFGEKDFQQLAIIKEMVKQTKLGIEIVGCPTIRTNTGLAQSSRNAKLDPQKRAKAQLIYETLSKTKEDLIHGKGIQALEVAFNTLQSNGFDVEYLSLADGESLQSLQKPKQGSRLFIAANYGGVRLIDNLPII